VAPDRKNTERLLRIEPHLKSIDIFVPATQDALRHIMPASAIVGISGTPDHDHTLVYFEGNRFGADNLRDFEARLQVALGRLLARYTTTAKLLLPTATLSRVATAREIGDTHVWVVAEILDETTLQRWLGNEDLPRIGGSAATRHRLASEAYRHMSPAQLSRLHSRAKSEGRDLLDLVFDEAF